MEKKRQMQNCALLSSKQSKMNGLQTERTPKRVTGPARKQDKNSFEEAWVQVTAGLQDYSLLNWSLLADLCVTCQFSRYGSTLYVMDT